MCSKSKIRHQNVSGLKLSPHILVQFPTVARGKGLHRQEASHLLSDSPISPPPHFFRAFTQDPVSVGARLSSELGYILPFFLRITHRKRPKVILK